MANSVAIPQDIIDCIIEAVGYDRHLLKECALVSSSFLLPSRRHLFSKLYLSSDQVCQRLHRFLVENPVVQSFVRSITIEILKPPNRSYECTSLIAILRLPFCCLESFSIIGARWYQPFSSWNDFSSELKDTLSTLIHLPTLKTLSVNKVRVPIMLFLGINLTKLELTGLSPDDFDGEQSRFLTQAASQGVATTASHTVVDHCVWNYFQAQPVHGAIFLPFMCRLRVLEIYINPRSATMRDFGILSFLIHSLRVSLTPPATLEHIKFKIGFYGDDNDIIIHYMSDFFDALRDDDVWSHLDSIITHPTGSRLQRVDINIEYHFGYDYNVMEPYENEVSKPVLDALPLLREKGILFVKATVR